MPEAPILVIDDDPDVLSTVVDILEFEGYPVERATNGAEGLKVLERTRPRLVLHVTEDRSRRGFSLNSRQWVA